MKNGEVLYTRRYDWLWCQPRPDRFVLGGIVSEIFQAQGTLPFSYSISISRPPFPSKCCENVAYHAPHGALCSPMEGDRSQIPPNGSSPSPSQPNPSADSFKDDIQVRVTTQEPASSRFEIGIPPPGRAGERDPTGSQLGVQQTADTKVVHVMRSLLCVAALEFA